jgi:hypothetical protein
MATDEVTHLCRSVVKGTRCKFLGTFPAWQMPHVDDWLAQSRLRDTAFVANTDVKEDEGEHWVLFYMPCERNRRPFFFDSFGRDPHQMGRPLWQEYLKEACLRRGGDGKWDENDARIQHPHTAVCGQLCGLALWKLARGRKLPQKYVELPYIVQFMRRFK